MKKVTMYLSVQFTNQLTKFWAYLHYSTYTPISRYVTNTWWKKLGIVEDKREKLHEIGT
jgi:hypothetical protein